VREPRLLSVEEGLGKMRAALAARSDPALVVVGRTSAVGIAGLDEAVARARLYSEAGVDALFFTGVSTLEQVKALHAASPLPIILGGSTLSDVAGMRAHGVRVALTGHQPIQAAFQAVYATMIAVRDGTALPPLADARLVKVVTKAADYDAAAKDFLGI
jgi:carboxyvinyl-carboxyphosphonate phosphorylmutase